GAFLREFDQRRLRERVTMLEPAEASVEDLLLFHTPAYIEFVQRSSEQGSGYLDAGDTPSFRGVYEVAASVVGGSLTAAGWIMAGGRRRAFAPIAGLHHAARDKAAGFCVFNDCGIVIEALRRRHGLERVAYIDIDAHHGDGVFYAFEDDPGVIFADIHESGETLYPGTGSETEVGRGAGAGTKLNLPLPAGSSDAQFRQVWPQVLEHIGGHDPQFLILQCGADSIAGDPLTNMRFTPAAHAQAARDLRALADRLGHGRLLALGGGGYDRANLARAWTGVLEALLEQ
ncbi:MAG: acetoin utilization protein AcuC, partial [Gammaproteobacteria bacterium]|nr:acetoin utilization protein AcuC [Gammaproteobacteria bacterium]